MAKQSELLRRIQARVDNNEVMVRERYPMLIDVSYEGRRRK